MKRSLHALLVVAALALAAIAFSCLDASLARAGIVYSGTNFDIEASTPVNVGITPLEAVTLTVIGKNGYDPDGFDGVVNGGTGITTVGNKLYQIYQGGFEKTPTLTMDDDYDPIPENLDTHFLVTTDSIIPITVPTENRLTLDSTENAYGGYGNKLTGAFSLIGDPNPTWDLAYLVTPSGTTVNLNFVIAGIKNGQYTSSETVQASFTVPEPSALAMLATCLLPLGVCGLLVRRRRLAA